MEKLLSVSELAWALGRSERYVWYMRSKGFEMIGGTATISAAREFQRKCKHPCAGVYKKTN